MPLTCLNMEKHTQISITLIILIAGIASGCNQNGLPQKTVQIFEAYDCDQLKTKDVSVLSGSDEIKTTLDYLPSPGGISTIAKYSKSFRVEKGIAYIDWPSEMSSLPNIDTSCAIESFLNPIEKTLTQFDSIDTVIHSMGGSVEAFYTRMGLICPKESIECGA